jgi:hypothetical protein
MPTYCYRSISAGDKRTGTLSFWIKRSAPITTAGYFWNAFGPGSFSGDTDWLGIRWRANDALEFVTWTGNIYILTNALFRDTAAWYHVVYRIDTTQASANDRVRLYINGEQITSFAHNNVPSQNHDFNCLGGSTAVHQIGCMSSGSLASPTRITGMSGYIAQAIYCQGQSLAPTSFGSTNANGVWIPNSQPSLTYGTNGFKLDFIGSGTSADASGFGADSSGNNNHMASAGLGTNPNTKDSCVNNFATMNPRIATQGQTPTYSKGDTIVTSTSNGSYGASALSTFAIDSGKWYWETKITGDRNNGIAIGLADAKWAVGSATDSWFGASNKNGYAFQFSNSGQKKSDNGTVTSYGTQIQVNDILGTAYDADNNTITWYINGSSQGQAFSSMRDITFVPASYGYYNTQWEFNFGNPPFSLSNTPESDANGYGNFEYAVPSGYYALCTKNLAAYGG